MKNTDYHDQVANYYDKEAYDFEKRAGQNHVLESLRQTFRDITMTYQPKKMLELGYGPGLDMEWFANQKGVEIIHGIDLTPSFYQIVKEKADFRGDGRIVPHLGTAEDASELLGTTSVDTVIVYFGALNTTDNLDNAAKAIANVLEPGGRAVLTFVNRWYMFDIFWNLLTLRPHKALARLGSVWGGYSPTRHLPSYCPSSRTVHRAFKPYLKRVKRKGFCIVHPAWYRQQWAPQNSLRSKIANGIDRLLQFTPFWNLGEYSLYIYERRID